MCYKHFKFENIRLTVPYYNVAYVTELLDESKYINIFLCAIDYFKWNLM